MPTSIGAVADNLSALKSHSWLPQPEPAKLVHRLLNECLQQAPFAANLAQRMLAETGTRMLDWIDHIGLSAHDSVVPELNRVGYVESRPIQGEIVWIHPGGLFPRLRQLQGTGRQLAIKVESVVDFLFAHQLTENGIEGDPFSPLRRACVERGRQVDFWVVERHGSCDFAPPAHRQSSSSESAIAIARHSEALRLRRRIFANDSEGFQHANTLIDAAIADLGRDRACDLFFAAEREYWQRRNRAGQIQLARQKVLGLGWANHDHHTYRSSRETFVLLIAFLEKLGFDCRERFYAGREAGWGAQVIEHPVTGVTIFADVDMSPEELSQDFSHQPLAPRDELGTVGLWCALHGEAFLQAGLHHLECQFDFAATCDQLKQSGIDTMSPFTDFPYLRQAFTRGEQWLVNPDRVERLRSKGRITDEQARQFLANGALGSHLEILQRDDGYKGFNQTGINEIISATDPRRAIIH
jgi:hypothetical protein